MALQIAVPLPGLVNEHLSVLGGTGLAIPVVETVGASGGRVHIVEAPAGSVTVSYEATTTALTTSPPATDGYDDAVLSMLRQSRYCPSDLMTSFARTELGDSNDPGKIAEVAASWVFERLAYVPGASGPGDTALDVLLSGQGTCRDFAHLTIAMCRALSVPARLLAGYAPGISPMDFHAVAEVWTGDHWCVHDPTRMAPRQSLVRVATGRDAADTALSATIYGDLELVTSHVVAVVDGELPTDDHTSPVTLP